MLDIFLIYVSFHAIHILLPHTHVEFLFFNKFKINLTGRALANIYMRKGISRSFSLKLKNFVYFILVGSLQLMIHISTICVDSIRTFHLFYIKIARCFLSKCLKPLNILHTMLSCLMLICDGQKIAFFLDFSFQLLSATKHKKTS